MVDNVNSPRSKAGKKQKKNPHRLTILQHVFPVRSIERFCNSQGAVTVKVLRSDRTISVSPDYELFCAKRVWDQRAEAGYMKRIEDQFQALANRIVSEELSSLGREHFSIITRFFGLWSSRVEEKHTLTVDRVVNGVGGESLTKDEEELLESRRFLYFRRDKMSGQTLMDSRFIVGMRIQMRVDQIADDADGSPWGIIRAHEGEFIAPDTFGPQPIVPLTPTICLRCGVGNGVVSKFGVTMMNRYAVQSARDYYMARDFAACPGVS